MSNRHTDLLTLLRSLKLQTMAECASEVAVKAVRNGLSHEAFLYELARLECEQREVRKKERLLRESGLPREKTFATLRLGCFGPLIRQQLERLRSGTFVQQAVNVVAIGRPGVGKSHLLASLGHELIAQGQSVLWHSGREGLQKDCDKRNVLVPLGWRLLVFTWFDVRHRPDEVVALVRAALAIEGPASK